MRLLAERAAAMIWPLSKVLQGKWRGFGLVGAEWVAQGFFEEKIKKHEGNLNIVSINNCNLSKIHSKFIQD